MKKLHDAIKGFIDDFRDYWFLLKPHFKYGKGYYLCSFIMNTVGDVGSRILWVYYYKIIIDMAVAGESFLSIMTIILLFNIGVFAVDFLRNDPLRKLCPEWEIKVHGRITRNIFEKAIQCDYRNFDDPDFYQNYTLAIKEYMNKSKQAFDYLKDVVTNIITFFTMIVLVSAVSPLILVATAVVLALSSVCGKMQNKYWEQRWEEISQINRRESYIERTIYMNTYAADLRCNRSGDYIIEQYDDTVKRRCGTYKRFKKPLLGLDILDFSAQRVIDLVSIGSAILKIVAGELSVGAFSSAVTATKYLYNSFDPIVYIWTTINDYALYSRKLQQFFNSPSYIESPAVNSGKQLAVKPTMPFALDLQKVSFSYDNSNFALKDISMSIKPGQKIAIVGENGAGKSTLTKLLLRLYDATSGDILINGRPIRDYDVHALRADIGIAFQNTNLFAMTFAENMKLYREVPDEKLREIVDKLGLSTVLDKFDGGLDAQITKEFDKNGIVLSGGETQKLGLARLFTGQFGLLILDEPSAALDPIAEYNLNKVIMELRNTTTIMISHRLSTVRDADCIYLIENGTVAESGSHSQLMKKNGRYAEMFRMQAENYVKEAEE